jgi:hypothetical protein
MLASILRPWISNGVKARIPIVQSTDTKEKIKSCGQGQTLFEDGRPVCPSGGTRRNSQPESGKKHLPVHIAFSIFRLPFLAMAPGTSTKRSNQKNHRSRRSSNKIPMGDIMRPRGNAARRKRTVSSRNQVGRSREIGGHSWFASDRAQLNLASCGHRTALVALTQCNGSTRA